MEKARKFEGRLRILDAILFAVENTHLVVQLIETSGDRTEARELLKKQFKMTDDQAQAIIDARMKTFTQKEKKRLLIEYQEFLRLYREASSEGEYMQSEFLHIKQYQKEVFQDIGYEKLKSIYEYAVMKLPYIYVLDNTDVGVVVLLECSQKEHAVLACGWDKYITRFIVTDSEIEIIDTNQISAQRYCTEYTLSKIRSSLWYKIKKLKEVENK